jgi:ribulose-phosphate 3-epimerase
MIDDLRLHTELAVDGGINNLVVPRLVKAGVDVIVSGSTLFSSSDVAEAIRDMKKSMNLSC